MDSNGPIDGGRSRRRVPPRTLIVGGIVAVVALGATGTVLAAALGHRDTPVAATGTGTQVFVPYQGSTVPGVSSGVAGDVAAAPAPALGTSSSAGLAAPVAPVPGGGVASSAILPPYYGGCTPQQADIQGTVVTATGSTRLDVSSIGQQLSLNAGIQDQSASDAGTALRNAQSRIDAIVNALVGAGIPRSAIHSSYYSVSPSYGVGIAVPPGVPAPNVEKVQSFSVNGSVSATATNVDQLARATNAAASAGASSVSVSSSSGYNVAEPPDDQLTAAIARATATAKRMATAAAAAAGVQLGGVHSVVVSPPAMCGAGAAGPQLTIAVTSAWDVH